MTKAHTASELYKTRRRLAEDQIKLLQTLLRQMDADQKKQPLYWGPPADLNHVNEKLLGLTNFLSHRV